ncbi:MAG TPA: DUF3624 family protein [Bacteroidia bacterium]|nr:DUF3624 family protein [Bacteroidia bacterium]
MEQNNDGCSGCGQQVIVENITSHVQQNTPCQGCRKNNFTGKLGTCIECIMANTIGAALCWIALLCFYIFYPEKMVLLPLLCFAAFFTLLLSAHGVAYIIKKKKFRKFH